MKRYAMLTLQWALAFSAGVHAGLAPEHLSEMPRVGASFVACAVVMSLLVFRPLPLLGLGVLSASVGAWLLAITSGIPFMMDGPEGIEQIAVVTKVAELAGIVAAIVLLVMHARRGAAAKQAPARRAATPATRARNARPAVQPDITRAAERIARRALEPASRY